MNTWITKLKCSTIDNCSEKEKCLGTNLTKFIKDFYAANYIMLLKEANDELYKWRTYTMFRDWENHHGKAISSPQIHTQV